MDRDALLAAALGAAVLTGCTTSSPTPPGPTPSPTPSATPEDPDLALLTAWATDERVLAARYAPAVRAVPALAALRANHVTRAAAVVEHLRVRGAAAPAVPAQPPTKAAPRALVAALADAERRLAGRYVAALGGVRDPLVVTLGAELAAGARQHAALLALVPVPR